MAKIKEVEHLTTPLERMTKDRDEWKAAYDDLLEKTHAQMQIITKKNNDLSAEVYLLEKELKARDTAESLYLKVQTAKDTARHIVRLFEDMVKKEVESMCVGHGMSDGYIYAGKVREKIEFIKELFSLGKGE